MEEFSIFVECHLGQLGVLPSPASQNQYIPLKHEVWLGLEAQPDCKMKEQGRPGALGPSVHFLPLPQPNPTPTPPLSWDGGSWMGPSQLSLSPARHARPGPALCFRPLPSSLFPLPFSSFPPPPSLLFSLCAFSLASFPPTLLLSILFPLHDQGWDPCPLQWKLRVLTTGPSGKSPSVFAFSMHSPLPPWQA